jgi:hypothetical protein
MEKTLSNLLKIEADWETLERGTPEDRACFAALGIQYGDIWLTRADDSFVNRLRDKVHLSAYRLAEWLAWNWWRLRWEPRSSRDQWALAHRMTTIGSGYVWPNITIFSDGERIVLLTKPTQSRAQEPLCYIEDVAAIVRANAFEIAVDQFIDQVRGQLRAEHVGTTNLDDLWDAVLAERADPAASKRRKFEALLGFDPDEADEAHIDTLIADSRALGEQAMAEVAANRSQNLEAPSAGEIRKIATDNGFDCAPRDVVHLQSAAQLPRYGEFPAWVRGATAARELRSQEKLEAGVLTNKRLAEWAGTLEAHLAGKKTGPGFSFALDQSQVSGCIVLRSKWETGRRFELARLVGDRLAGASGGKLFPATRSNTYRQKLQRAFAAELLCPFEALMGMLQGDFSPEAIEEAAQHFNVSALTVRTLLVNHRRIERDDIDGDVESQAAA